MNNVGENKNIEVLSDVQAGAKVEGMPSWAERELSSEYVDVGRKGPGIDLPFLVITLLLLLIGIVMVLSASYVTAYQMSGEPLRFFTRQLIFAVSGVALMLVVSRLSVKTMSRWSTHLLLAAVALLILVLIVGITVNGARRWMGIGGENSSFTFQPSEIAKIAVILSFAQMICIFGRKKMRTFKYGVLPFVAITAVIVFLLIREPHYSAAIIIIALAAIMMFAGGTRLRWFFFAAAAVVALAALLLFPNMFSFMRDGGTSAALEQADNPQMSLGSFNYAGRRINSWLDPDSDPLGDGFQIRQSLNAVGSGGLLGQGLGQSRQKHLYLPEEHNDFIFAIVAEELGFIGAMLILLLFALLIVRGYWLALHAKDRYSSLIVIGITSLLAIQVFLNVAVVTNIVPATGISLPFFSYGGTALWIQLVQMGIVLAVSRNIPLTKSNGDEPEEQESMAGQAT
jgi:cell division protein FtsW